jgi:hypothetical protein
VSTRARWIVGVVLVLVLGVVALYLFNSSLTMSSEDERGPKTWVVQPGETLTLSADEVQPNDSYSCPGKGAVGYTPEPGEGVANSLGIQVTTDIEGMVEVACEPGPPGNV